MAYSALAWVLAQTASLEATDGGGMRATVTIPPFDQRVSGLGATSTAAMHDLAVALDRWSTGYGPIESM